MKTEEEKASIRTKHGYLRNNQYKTYYEIHNPDLLNGNSKPIILLAGGPGLSYTTLTPLLNLSDRRSVIAYDQFGSGNSTRSEQFNSLSVKDFIVQFNSLMTHLGISNYHLLGHSWGTVLGVNIALKYPENVQSLILHSGIADWKECLLARKQFQIEHFTDDLKLLYKKINEGNFTKNELENYKRMFNSLFYCRSNYPNYLTKALNDKDSKTNNLIWNPEINREMADYNICYRLREIQCHTLVISGKYDGISVGQSGLFNDGIRNSSHIELKNSSHYAHIEEEKKFMNTVREFLKLVEV